MQHGLAIRERPLSTMPGQSVRTEDIFGELLHAYTIREAIADQNVLGFKVDFETTIDEEEMKERYLPGFYREQHPDWTDEQIRRQDRQHDTGRYG